MNFILQTNKEGRAISLGLGVKEKNLWPLMGYISQRGILFLFLKKT
jgi:hypothetical protein